MKTRLTLSVVLAVALASSSMNAQAPKTQIQFPDYEFTTVVSNPITSIKNQYRSGTCWAYSTVAFFESEVIRINKIKDEAQYPELSVMYVVSNSYKERAEKYVRLDGNLTFSVGSEADDALHVAKDHGFVPKEIMPGNNYGTELPVFGEIDAVAKAYVEAIAKNPNRTLTTAWKRGFDAIIDTYLGECPETFTYNGQEYTPASYRDALKFNPDDYVTLTSYTHHPFYTKFAIEVCDNWRWDEAYNIPIDEFMDVLKGAIENGFTAAWGTDVSSAGFTRDGLAILVDTSIKPTSGSDQERWVGKDKGDESKAEPAKIEPPVELVPTQESRQKDFDNKTLTDDHGMQIYGIAKDQFGKTYYMVKNSWGETGRYKGIWYASEAFVKGSSMDIMVHKDALPKDLKKKLGIK